MYPALIAFKPGSTEYSVEIDHENYSWPTLTIWSNAATPQRWLEWGVFPAADEVQETKESLEGTFCSLCFRFDSDTGRFFGVEIPANVIRQCIQSINHEKLPNEVGGSFDAIVGAEFWTHTGRRNQRAIIAPTRSYLKRNEIRVEFFDGPLEWLPLSNDIWLARSTDHRLAGIWCISSTIDFYHFAKSI